MLIFSNTETSSAVIYNIFNRMQKKKILKIFNGQQVLSVSGSWRTFHKKKSTPIFTNFWKDKIRCSQKPTSILKHTLTKRKREKTN